jgi:hypothetical protein
MQKYPTTVLDLMTEEMKSRSDGKLHMPSIKTIPSDQISDPKAWTEAIPPKRDATKLIVLIRRFCRQDIFEAIKKALIEIHVPCLVWDEKIFPSDDRDRWQEKYAHNRLNEVLTKLGSPNQTDRWRLSALGTLKNVRSKKCCLFLDGL